MRDYTFVVFFEGGTQKSVTSGAFHGAAIKATALQMSEGLNTRIEGMEMRDDYGKVLDKRGKARLVLLED